FFFSPSISIACITFCRKSELYGFGIVIAQTIRFLSILCPNLAGYSYIIRLRDVGAFWRSTGTER
ncbi:MAG: hypothetical protein NT070_13490, partial [Cyanobacteria bacterium]|nr:hypothetical protein [Cyanobacteriota bacterium]